MSCITEPLHPSIGVSAILGFRDKELGFRVFQLTWTLWAQDIAVSSGSACTSASLEPSYVLRALGVEEDMAHTSLRFGLGRFTTEAEVDRAVALTVQHVTKLREMSPLWDLVKEGVDLKTIQWSQH